jgi:hypothetical protein
MNNKNRDRAEQLMRDYTQTVENKKALQATIANEVKAYDDNLKKFGEELLALGEEHKAEFDADGNFHLADGYLHIVNSAVVVTKKKFDVGTFNEAHPEFIEITLKKGDIKKAFMDKDLRKELTALGVTMDNEQKITIIPNKKE